MPISPTLVDQLTQLGATGLLVLLVGLTLLAFSRGWIVPRYAHDQVVCWNDDLLAFAGKMADEIERLADVIAQSGTIPVSGRDVAAGLRDDLPTPPGPSRREHQRYPARTR